MVMELFDLRIVVVIVLPSSVVPATISSVIWLLSTSGALTNLARLPAARSGSRTVVDRFLNRHSVERLAVTGGPVLLHHRSFPRCAGAIASNRTTPTNTLFLLIPTPLASSHHVYSLLSESCRPLFGNIKRLLQRYAHRTEDSLFEQTANERHAVRHSAWRSEFWQRMFRVRSPVAAQPR